MKPMRTALAVAATAAALTSCSSGGAAATPASSDPSAAAAVPTSAAAPQAAGVPAGGPEEAVQTAFLAYNQALGAKDYAKACDLSTTEAQKRLVAALTAQNITVATCEEALTAVLARPEAAASTDQLVKSLHVDGVTVDGGTAKVMWSAQAGGKPQSTTSGMSDAEGGWKLLPTS